MSGKVMEVIIYLTNQRESNTYKMYATIFESLLPRIHLFCRNQLWFPSNLLFSLNFASISSIVGIVPSTFSG